MFGFFRSKIQESDRKLIDHILLLMREDPDGWDWQLSPRSATRSATLTYKPKEFLVKIAGTAITICTSKQNSEDKSFKKFKCNSLAKEIYETAVLIQNDWAMKRMRVGDI